MKKITIAFILLGLVLISSATSASRSGGGLLFYAKYGYQSDTSAIANPHIAGGMFQIYWSAIETADSLFDWREFDRWLTPWKTAGKKVGIRIMWSSSGYWPDSLAATPTPAWVWAKGAVKALHQASGTEIPLFWDLIYRHYAFRFLRECARKFDRDTSVFFLDVTPGAETNPYRFGTIDEKDSTFRATFISTPASDGRVYSESLWISEVQSFMDSAAVCFTRLPILVTLNAGCMPGEGSNLSANGNHAVALNFYVGQNGIKGDSYTSASPFMDWADQTHTFFEMVANSGGTTGTLMEVMEAAVRAKASYLNVYPEDVLKGTLGQSGYDSLYEAALRFGAENLTYTDTVAVPVDPLKGFVLTGNPEASTGATWTYKDTVESVIYDLTGILRKPAGNGPFPAVVVNHGTGGNASGYSRSVANTMVTWGYVCIAVNYTHSSNVACGLPGACVEAEYGASPANLLRGMKCWDLLAALGYVDTTRIAAFGHSRGAFVTTGLVASFPSRFAAAAHTAGGAAPDGVASSAPSETKCRAILAPYLIHHGDADGTVDIRMDYALDSVFGRSGTPHAMYVYPGYSHSDVRYDTLMYTRTRDWFATYLSVSTAVQSSVPISSSVTLHCSPNPSSPNVTLRVGEAGVGQVWHLAIYNSCGRLVHTAEIRGTGGYRWRPENQPSGIYLARVTSGNRIASKTIILQK